MQVAQKNIILLFVVRALALIITSFPRNLLCLPIYSGFRSDEVQS